ncbi:MAG: DUF6316 family protein [Gammaproteobacteria bacterium]|nr:DUF6316 family protein [Gammaproteobacteria bacterium]
MATSLPTWFQADKVFTHDGNWYLGSLGSLHIGPYGDRATAETKAIRVCKELRALESDGNQLRYVRRLLHEEWKEIRIAVSDGEICLTDVIELTPPPAPVRRGEQEKNWFRSGRFFKVSGAWFFTTRENINIGPFQSELEAKMSEQQLVALLRKDLTEQEVQKIVYEYKHRPPN